MPPPHRARSPTSSTGSRRIRGSSIYNRPDKGGSDGNFVRRAIHKANGRDPSKFTIDNYSLETGQPMLAAGFEILRDLAPSLYEKGAYTSGNTQSVQPLAQGVVTMVPVWSDQTLQAIAQGVLPEDIGLVQLTDLALAGGFSRTVVPTNAANRELELASFVLDPEILPLDEPFASLDQHLRERLREEVRKIQQRLRITTLFVTHGQDEVLALADRIALMRAGRLEQIDRPEILYRQPRTRFVAGFIGHMNFVDGAVRAGRFRHPRFDVDAPISDGPATLAVRPEAMRLVERHAARTSAVPVRRATDFGTHAIVELVLDVPPAPPLRVRALKAPPLERWAGETYVIAPSAWAILRSDDVVHRSDAPSVRPMPETGGETKSASHDERAVRLAR